MEGEKRIAGIGHNSKRPGNCLFRGEKILAIAPVPATKNILPGYAKPSAFSIIIVINKDIAEA